MENGPAPGDVLVHEADQLLHVHRVGLARQEDDGVGPLVGHDPDRHAPRSLGRKDGDQRLDDLRRQGRLERDVGDHLPDSLHVEGGDDPLKPLDVGQDIGDDQHPRRGVGKDDAVFRDQRIEDFFHLVGAGVLKGEDLRHDPVRGIDRLRLHAEIHVLPAGILGEDHLGHVSRINRRESVNLQYRLEHLVYLVDGDLIRGDHRHLPLDFVVDHKVPAGQLADELDEDLNIDTVEVDRHITASLRRRRQISTMMGTMRRLYAGKPALTERRGRSHCPVVSSAPVF